jgi:hypothetical protein
MSMFYFQAKDLLYRALTLTHEMKKKECDTLKQMQQQQTDG